MQDKALAEFGVLFINRVRDAVIEDWHMILDGRMKGARADAVRTIVAEKPQCDRETLLNIVNMVTDSALHHMMWMVEDEKAVDITFVASDGRLVSIKKTSDGPPGELYGAKGWIAQFSKFQRTL